MVSLRLAASARVRTCTPCSSDSSAAPEPPHAASAQMANAEMPTNLEMPFIRTLLELRRRGNAVRLGHDPPAPGEDALATPASVFGALVRQGGSTWAATYSPAGRGPTAGLGSVSG